jgi:hypothetical protein
MRGHSLLGPLVLATDLVLLLGGEVILDVEDLTDLFWGLALDHVGDGLAADVEEGFDVKVVGSLWNTFVSESQIVRFIMLRELSLKLAVEVGWWGIL